MEQGRKSGSKEHMRKKNRREHQTLGEGPVIYINVPERGNFNNNNSMDARSVWERSYEDDYASLLNKLGVTEAAYEGL